MASPWLSVGASLLALLTALAAAAAVLKLHWKSLTFAVKSIGGSVPHEPPGALRLLTLNVFTLPWPFSSDGNGDSKTQRLHAFCERHLSRYDVIGLQELFGGPSGRRDAVLAYAKSVGLRYHAGPFPPRLLSRRLIDGGCVLLSRYPLARVHFHEFRHHLFPDSVASKGVLSAEVLLGSNALLHVFVTHLQAGYTIRDVPAERIRRRQLLELRDCVQERARSSDPAVVMGDFNTDASDAEAYGALRRALPDQSGSINKL